MEPDTLTTSVKRSKKEYSIRLLCSISQMAKAGTVGNRDGDVGGLRDGPEVPLLEVEAGKKREKKKTKPRRNQYHNRHMLSQQSNLTSAQPTSGDVLGQPLNF